MPQRIGRKQMDANIDFLNASRLRKIQAENERLERTYIVACECWDDPEPIMPGDYRYYETPRKS